MYVNLNYKGMREKKINVQKNYKFTDHRDGGLIDIDKTAYKHSLLKSLALEGYNALPLPKPIKDYYLYQPDQQN